MKFKNIIITPLKKEDIDDIVRMLNNPNMWIYLPFAPAPEEMYRGYFEPMAEIIANSETPSSMVYILREKGTNKFIGNYGIMGNPMNEGVFEIGYQITEEFWRKGIGTYIAKLAIEYAFKKMKAHRVEANCYSTNIGSKKVLEKAGLLFEGDSKGYYKTDEKIISKSNYGLFRG
ncbi:GNAT family N-acetyltransferase [Psychrilyobacter sp.]|uniref:GNAT family N-acetyltransferase n=1 Tax=Psychrilyobacter sp. TaxID=2586924 RepID=UPI00301B5E3E